MTVTVQADGGVVDLREAEAATPDDVLDDIPANFRTEELPTPALFAAAQDESATEPAAPIPDVEIPEWIRAEPAREEPAVAAEAVTPSVSTEAFTPPVEARNLIEPEPEVALSPFGDETPPRGVPEVVGGSLAAAQTAGAAEVAEVVNVAEAVHEVPAPDAASAATADSSTVEVARTAIPMGDERREWDREEPLSAPDAPVYAADEAFEWATSAVTATHAVPSAEALAEALEGLAQRLRNGELDASLYRPGMSDAAALTAALAAVLGVRR